MPDSNIKQAAVIPSCQVIPNPRGTAPGWWVEKDKHVVIAMPGPPGEMQQMWSNVVAPKIQEKYCDAIIFSQILKTFSLNEAKLGEITKPFLLANNPTVGIYAKPDGIHLRIAAKANTLAAARELVAATTGQIRQLVGEYIWGTDADTLEGIVSNQFHEKKLSLSTMEVGTGGILANCITNIPLSSGFYKHGMVVNFNEPVSQFGINENVVGQYGIVSQETAREMATAVRRLHETSVGVGLVGVMESDEQGQKMGTIMIGIDNGAHNYAFSKNYPGTRMQIKQRAAIAALFELRKIML
jgi:nicotinamide-nucleotide amidase